MGSTYPAGNYPLPSLVSSMQCFSCDSTIFCAHVARGTKISMFSLLVSNNSDDCCHKATFWTYQDTCSRWQLSSVSQRHHKAERTYTLYSAAEPAAPHILPSGATACPGFPTNQPSGALYICCQIVPQVKFTLNSKIIWRDKSFIQEHCWQPNAT
jgi:hypothetical protein